MRIALKTQYSAEDIDVVRDGLAAANREASGREDGYRPFVVHLIDSAGKPVGGLSGWAAFDWLQVQMLHVPRALRGQGLGRALMARAEAFAREVGCIGMWLDTFSFQARPFYEKLGYEVFGTLEDHPIGGRRFFMRKRLDRISN